MQDTVQNTALKHSLKTQPYLLPAQARQQAVGIAVQETLGQRLPPLLLSRTPGFSSKASALREAASGTARPVRDNSSSLCLSALGALLGTWQSSWDTHSVNYGTRGTATAGGGRQHQ